MLIPTGQCLDKQYCADKDFITFSTFMSIFFACYDLSIMFQFDVSYKETGCFNVAGCAILEANK